MVWSLSAIVLLGIICLVTGDIPNHSPDANADETKSLSVNNVDFPSLLTTLSKRSGISRIDNGLLSFPPQSYPYRPADGGPSSDEAAVAEEASSQNTNYPQGARDALGWFNSQFIYGVPADLSRNEGNEDSPHFAPKSTREPMDKPLNWKRRLQMKGPGLMGSTLGQKGFMGYNRNRNKGMVLSIDLGIKALRDAIYHAKVKQQRGKLQAQTQRNLKLLHNIGKRRAGMQEQI